MITTEHWTRRMKRELTEASETIGILREKLNARPEIPVYATLFDGVHGCLNYQDKGNERRRSLSGSMDKTEVLFRADRAPVFDITNVPMADLCRIGDLPLSERVAALDAIFCPRILRA